MMGARRGMCVCVCVCVSWPAGGHPISDLLNEEKGKKKKENKQSAESIPE